MLVEASPQAVRVLAELGEPGALALKTAIDTGGNAQSAVDYLKAAIGNDLAGTIKTIGSIAAGVAIGEAVAITVAAGVGVVVSLQYALLIGAIAGIASGVYGPKIYDEGWDAAYNVGRIISDKVNSNFTDAQNFVIPRRDPLVLDLDGDGLELIGANGTVLFDHNADGIKTGTGWVRPDDGLLVRDLNGNGLIDSGRELFGIDTLKANNTLATNGFDALKELDSNADGKITSSDTAYAELKVWRDANQDGISQAAELQSLSALGISSIGVNGTATGPQAGQVIAGNRVDLSTTFTQNGAARTVGAIDFQVNNFYSQFAAQVVDQAGNPVAITAQALALPQMNGSGMVRNMQAAASLSGEIVKTLKALAAASAHAIGRPCHIL